MDDGERGSAIASEIAMISDVLRARDDVINAARAWRRPAADSHDLVLALTRAVDAFEVATAKHAGCSAV